MVPGSYTETIVTGPRSHFNPANGGVDQTATVDAIPLDAAAGTTYAGSLRQVISRLLDGYNYVVKTDQETTEIVVFGRSGEAVAPPPAAKPSPSEGILSRWR